MQDNDFVITSPRFVHIFIGYFHINEENDHLGDFEFYFRYVL